MSGFTARDDGKNCEGSGNVDYVDSWCSTPIDPAAHRSARLAQQNLEIGFSSGSPNYPRRAVAALIRVARRAGRYAAAAAAATRTAPTPANVAGSSGATPYNNETSSRVDPTASPTPAARPAAVITTPLEKTSRMISPRVAPSAWRTPNSCRR